MCGDTRWCGKDNRPELFLKEKSAPSPLMIHMAEYFNFFSVPLAGVRKVCANPVTDKGGEVQALTLDFFPFAFMAIHL
jgi:hypothetical protein